MSTYQVSARNKKSTIENEYWAHKKDPNKSFRKELGWRWGNFLVKMTKEEFEALDKENENGEFYPYSYDDSELLDCTDGCWEDFDFSDSTLTEEEQKEIQDAWNEDSFDGLEALGYQQIDGEIILLGPLDFTLDSEDDEDDVEQEKELPDLGQNLSGFTTLAQTLKDKE